MLSSFTQVTLRDVLRDAINEYLETTTFGPLSVLNHFSYSGYAGKKRALRLSLKLNSEENFDELRSFSILSEISKSSSRLFFLVQKKILITGIWSNAIYSRIVELRVSGHIPPLEYLAIQTLIKDVQDGLLDISKLY